MTEGITLYVDRIKLYNLQKHIMFSLIMKKVLGSLTFKIYFSRLVWKKLLFDQLLNLEILNEMSWRKVQQMLSLWLLK